MKRKYWNYLIYRVLVRLNEQAQAAIIYGREKNAWALSKLIGRLEYQHFKTIGFEYSLDAATAKGAAQ